MRLLKVLLVLAVVSRISVADDVVVYPSDSESYSYPASELQAVTLSTRWGAESFTLSEQHPMASVTMGGGWRYVQDVRFHMEATGRTAQIEVLANGVQVCLLPVPAQDPAASCRVRAAARTLEFHYLSGGNVKIWAITASQSRQPIEAFHRKDYDRYAPDANFDVEEFAELRLPQTGIAVYLAGETIRTVDRLLRRMQNEILAGEAHIRDRVRHLHNIKLTALFAKAHARPNTDLSFGTLFAMLRLQKQIDAAKPVFIAMARRGDLFNGVGRLLEIRETIEDRLDTHKLEAGLEDARKSPVPYGDYPTEVDREGSADYQRALEKLLELEAKSKKTPPPVPTPSK